MKSKISPESYGMLKKVMKIKPETESEILSKSNTKKLEKIKKDDSEEDNSSTGKNAKERENEWWKTKRQSAKSLPNLTFKVTGLKILSSCVSCNF